MKLGVTIIELSNIQHSKIFTFLYVRADIVT